MKYVSGSIQQVGSKIHAVNALIDAAGSSLTVQTMSLRAGLRAAFSYVIANVKKKGGRT